MRIPADDLSRDRAALDEDMVLFCNAARLYSCTANGIRNRSAARALDDDPVVPNIRRGLCLAAIGGIQSRRRSARNGESISLRRVTVPA